MSKWSSIKQDEVIREGDRGEKKEDKEVRVGIWLVEFSRLD